MTHEQDIADITSISYAESEMVVLEQEKKHLLQEIKQLRSMLERCRDTIFFKDNASSMESGYLGVLDEIGEYFSDIYKTIPCNICGEKACICDMEAKDGVIWAAHCTHCENYAGGSSGGISYPFNSEREAVDAWNKHNS